MNVPRETPSVKRCSRHRAARSAVTAAGFLAPGVTKLHTEMDAAVVPRIATHFTVSGQFRTELDLYVE